MKTIISTPKAPAALGPYSQAVKIRGTVFLSGQLGIDPATGELVEGGVEAQTRQALANMCAVLEAADINPLAVVKTTVFIVDMADFAAVNKVYGETFKNGFPARSCIAVAQLPKGARVEIEAIAIPSGEPKNPDDTLAYSVFGS